MPALTARDNNNGGLKRNTKIGIAIGLILFVALLVSFYFVARYRKKRVPRTADDRLQDETLDRWMVNMTRPAGARQGHDGGRPERRESSSTCATLTPSTPKDLTRRESPTNAHQGTSR